ncbi:MAG: ABC transporter permease [Acidimicrobiales bacterium]
MTWAYVTRRVGQSVAVVVGVTVIVFVIIHLLPGGPARALLGAHARPEQIHAFNVANGYDLPVYEQYVRYLGHLLQGNLGYSYHYNESVSSLLAQNLPKTALLVGLAYFFSLCIAMPLGIFQASRRNSAIDHLFTGVSFLGYSMPDFWLGILLILAFGVSLKLLPVSAPQGDFGAILSQPAALVLPVATLATGTIAWFSRYTRSSAIEHLILDYVRTARAKGASQWRVLFRHLPRNCLTPVITLVGLSLPVVLSGAVVTETVFNYPGMGLMFWNAATSQDYPLLMGFTVVVGVATVVGNLVADLLYAAADPRVRYS